MSFSFFFQSRLALQVRVLAANLAIEGPDLVHVLLNIPAGDQKHPQAAQLSPIIEIAQTYGYTGLQSNVIKTGSPARDFASRSLRRNSQHQIVGASEPLCQLLYQGVRRSPVNGNTSESSQQPSPRKNEESVFAKPGYPQAHCIRRRQHEREVPIRRMRSGD